MKDKIDLGAKGLRVMVNEMEEKMARLMYGVI